MDKYESLIKDAQRLFPEFGITNCDVYCHSGDDKKYLRFWQKGSTEVSLMYPRHIRGEAWSYMKYLDDPRLHQLVVIAKLKGLL